LSYQNWFVLAFIRQNNAGFSMVVLEVSMLFPQKVKDLAARSRHASAHALTEEATKTSVILPMIQSLGFDVFNLQEVTPEYVADVGTKKGEKIDFALKIDGKVAILIEAKPISMALGYNQVSQLYRYFGVSGARLAILTNGKEIWFFPTSTKRTRWTSGRFLSLISKATMIVRSMNSPGSKRKPLRFKRFWRLHPILNM
jgi:hypothetical protein